MLGEAQNQRLGAPLLWLSALALAGAGAVHTLRSTGHAAGEPVLHAMHGLAGRPCVSIRQLGDAALDEDLRVAMLRLGLRWEERGFTVKIPGLALDAPDEVERGLPVAQQEVLLGTLGAPASDDPELERRAWLSLGLRRRGDAWVTPDGRTWPWESSALTVTVTQRNLRGVTRRLGLLGLVEPVFSDAALVTLSLAPVLNSDDRTAPLRSLSRSLPSSPGVALWNDGQRVFEAEFDEGGFATDRVRTSARASAPPHGPMQSNTAAYVALAESASAHSAAIRGFAKKPPLAVPLQVAELQRFEAHHLGGARQRCGWYDAAQHRLMVVPGVAASADDAVEDFLETELLRCFGRPAAPWFLRGLIYVRTGRAGGFPLMDLESRSQPVALEDVLAPTRQRTRLALAAAEARLTRGVLAEFNSDIASAWSAGLREDEEMAERLRSQWKAGLIKAPVIPPTGSPREWAGGIVIEIVSPARGLGQFGSAELHADFERIASLGFSGVQLTVHVPVVPPTPAERSDVPFELHGWGYGVTLEGDGALLASVAAAKALELSVVIEPRFVVSATGVLGHEQIFGSPERIRQYGDRRALAMEGVAWLAEQAGADALVMVDSEELPREIGSDPPAWKRQAEEARTIIREQSAVYSSPFKGEGLAFSRSLAGLSRAIGASAPGTAPLTSVGLEVALDGMDAPKGRARRVQLASREAGGQLRALRMSGMDPTVPPGEEPTWSVLSLLRSASQSQTSKQTEAMPHAVLLGPWHTVSANRSSAELVSGEPLPANLRDLPDERLRQLAVLPR